MRRWPAIAAAGLMMAAVGGAWAQKVQLEPSAAQRCLTGPSEPEYPFVAWKMEQSAEVKAQLRFTAPDRPPEAEIQVTGGEDQAPAFKEAVRVHVAQLRLPCLERGAGPVQLSQIYDFRPDSRKAYASRPVDADAARRQAALSCITRIDKEPDYPERARRDGVQGVIIGQMLFEAPDRPPAVKLHARRAMRPLLFSAESFFAGFRMPCLEGAPVLTSMALVFRFEGEAQGFKPLTLPQLLGSVRGLKTAGFKMDTTAMGCPFDLFFRFRQPHLPNSVMELGSTHPTRRPLIEFLERADLEGSERTLDAIYGDSTTVTVPCLNIAIPPQEKTS